MGSCTWWSGGARSHTHLVLPTTPRPRAPHPPAPRAPDAAEGSGEPLGRPRRPLDDTGASEEDELDARLYGTHDVMSAIEQGTSWVPPESPTQEGFGERIGDSDPQDEEPGARP